MHQVYVMCMSLIIFRSEKVIETIVVHQEQNLLFCCVCLLLQAAPVPIYMYIVMSCIMVRTELKGLTRSPPSERTQNCSCTLMCVCM